VAVDDGKLGDEIFAFVFIEDQIFFCGGSCEEIDFDLLLVFVGEGDLVVVGDAGVGLGLFVLVAFFVVVVLVVDGVVEAEAVDVPVDAGRDYFSVVVGNRDVLHVICQRK
jgi:hypothetical protein